jgi:hypothetical protein
MDKKKQIVDQILALSTDQTQTRKLLRKLLHPRRSHSILSLTLDDCLYAWLERYFPDVTPDNVGAIDLDNLPEMEASDRTFLERSRQLTPNALERIASKMGDYPIDDYYDALRLHLELYFDGLARDPRLTPLDGSM